MRLNFSGVDEDEIREGIRRIGEVVREQVALYGTLTGAAPAAPRQAARPPDGQRPAAEHGPRRAEPPRRPGPELAKILRLPAQRTRAG